MRPDSTPPDDSLFPIAPCYTAELDAKALDEIHAALSDAAHAAPEDVERLTAEASARVIAALRSTGRDPRFELR
jgi:hypothetical protein